MGSGDPRHEGNDRRDLQPRDETGRPLILPTEEENPSLDDLLGLGDNDAVEEHDARIISWVPPFEPGQPPCRWSRAWFDWRGRMNGSRTWTACGRAAAG